MNRRYEQLSMDFVYGICHYGMLTIHDMVFRGEVVGTENFPNKGAFLVAANHASHLDPAAVGTHLWRQVSFFARKTLWKRGFASWWLNAVGTIPVDRDGSDVTAIKRVLQAIKEDKVLILFPEGTRSTNGELQTPKAGVGFIACRTGVPVVPARVFGSFEAFGRSGKVNFGAPISVTYGKPLLASDYDDPTAGKERYQRASERIMSAIASLTMYEPPVI